MSAGRSGRDCAPGQVDRQPDAARQAHLEQVEVEGAWAFLRGMWRWQGRWRGSQMQHDRLAT